MKTLYDTLKQTTLHLDVSKPQLKSFSKEFTTLYEDFLTDFVFSSTNNAYSVFNGLFISKIKNYFKGLYDKYEFTDNTLLLNSAFVYQFFTEMEGLHAGHSYRSMSPFTMEELLDTKYREKTLVFKNLNFNYKNIKDVGNAALFLTLVIINSGFTVKLKDIDTCLTRHKLNFMFTKNHLINSITNEVQRTVEDVLFTDKLITSENLALIQFMQIFLLEDNHAAMCSIRTSPNSIRGVSDLPSTLKSTYYYKQTLLGKFTSINLLFPEMINNRVSLFNVILGNSQGLLEGLYAREGLSSSTLQLIQLSFITLIKRFTEVLMNPTDRVSDVLNMFYTPVQENTSDTAFRITTHSSSFYHINFTGLTEMRDVIIGHNPYVVDGTITRYGLTDIVENCLPIGVINQEFKDYDFSSSSMSDEIETLLDGVVEIYTTYSKFSKQLNIISVEILKCESTIKTYDSRDKSFLIPVLEDEKFLSNYYSAPFFIMNALTSLDYMFNDNLPKKSTINQDTFFTSYSRHLSKKSEKQPYPFFLDASKFDNIEYINTLLALEIKSQLLLLQHFPQYYFIYGDMLKFRMELKNGQNSSYGAQPKFSLIVGSISKTLPITLRYNLSTKNEVDNSAILFALNDNTTNGGIEQDLESFMINEFLLKKYNPELLNENPVINTFFTYTYRLLTISNFIFKVFNKNERNSEKIFDVRLTSSIKDEVFMYKRVNEFLANRISKEAYYDYSTGSSKTSFFVDVSKATSLTDAQISLIELVKIIDIELTQDLVLDVLLESGLPAVKVSPFIQKFIELVLKGTEQFTTTINTSNNTYSIFDSISQLLANDTAKTVNIYEEKVNSIMNGNNIISAHIKTLAQKSY